MNNRHTYKKLGNIALWGLTGIILIVAIGPLLWFAEIAFKPQVLAWAMPPKFIFIPTFDNFKQLLFSSGSDGFINAFKNSIIVSVSTTVISLFLGLTSGYALARSNFRFSRYMGIWVILTRMAPPMIFLLPFYKMLAALHLSGSYTSLIICYLVFTLPVVTWMMSSY